MNGSTVHHQRYITLGILLAFSLTAAKAYPAQLVLIPTNAVWRYLDDGSNQEFNWVYPEFDDSEWPDGPAELGYGDEEDNRPEATMISYGADADNKHITTYFRHSFVLTNTEPFWDLKVRLLRDDGAVVYVNGTEVFRSGMPEGQVAYDILAEFPGVSGAAEAEFVETVIDPFFLLRGELNVIGVEVHQSASDSPDLSFALELVADVDDPPPPPLAVIRGPYLQSGTRTTVVVRWRTNVPSDTRVQFGAAPDQLSRACIDSTLTTEHLAVLAGLSPGTKYFYAIGTTTNVLAGDATHYFVTAPASAKPVRIWALGDCGTASAGHPGSQLVRDAYYAFAGNREPDVWLMLGDNAYYYGEDHEYQAAVFETYHDMLRRCVLWSTVGNHETYSLLNPRPNIPYFDIFTLPTAGEAGGLPSGTEHYYSFDYANIHFVCLDSEESIRLPDIPMLAWLDQDLAANTNDWTIVFWHSPPYTKGSHNSDNLIDSAGRLFQMRTNVVPILEAHGVDMVLNGHSHSYERSYPLKGHYGTSDTLIPDMVLDAGSGQEDDTGAYLKGENGGVVYVVAGSSGWATFLTGLHPAMHTTHLRMGSLVIDVDGKRLDAKFLRETGTIDDYFTILKDSAPAPFRIVKFWHTEEETVLRWKSVRGKSYQIEECLAFSPMSWNVISEVITATGATTSWTNEFPVLTEKVFYRMELHGKALEPAEN